MHIHAQRCHQGRVDISHPLAGVLLSKDSALVQLVVEPNLYLFREAQGVKGWGPDRHADRGLSGWDTWGQTFSPASTFCVHVLYNR